MPLKLIPSAVIVCAALLVFSACGGGGGSGGRRGGSSSHTYIVAAPKQNSAGAGIYVTLVSPVAIPTRLLTKHGARIVSHASGPQACSLTKTVHGSKGPGAFLDGKTLTIKVNGSNPLLSTICSLLKKTPFNANKIGGA